MENLGEKSDKTSGQIVAIDGTAIRKVREAKKLTQLYVASVVGVTTDTISRWENNRYPTIKRDNAEKLAAALEVELDVILRREPEVAVEEAQPEEPAPEGRRRGPVLALATILVVVFAAVAYLFLRPAPPLVATRWVPRFGAPGQVIPVKVRVERPDGESGGLIVKERIPAGWHFVNSSPPVAGEAGSSEVKWLIAGGKGPVTISYTLLIPRDAPMKGRVGFAGSIVQTDGSRTRSGGIGGDGGLEVGGHHWADANGDGRIDDNEIMPAYYLTEEMKGLGLDWKTIETIWSGRGYGWDDKQKGFEVVK